MFEKILLSYEAIELYDECMYCGNGKTDTVYSGYVILTDKRIVLCKEKSSPIGTVFSLVFTGISLIAFQFLDSGGGIVGAAIFGAIIGAISGLIGHLIGKAIGKRKPLEKTEYSFYRRGIASIEYGSRGHYRKMFLIKTAGGDACKVLPKDEEKKEEFRVAFMQYGLV